MVLDAFSRSQQDRGRVSRFSCGASLLTVTHLQRLAFFMANSLGRVTLYPAIIRRGRSHERTNWGAATLSSYNIKKNFKGGGGVSNSTSLPLCVPIYFLLAELDLVANRSVELLFLCQDRAHSVKSQRNAPASR